VAALIAEWGWKNPLELIALEDGPVDWLGEAEKSGVCLTLIAQIRCQHDYSEPL
jgi:hypothetical protein